MMNVVYVYPKKIKLSLLFLLFGSMVFGCIALACEDLFYDTVRYDKPAISVVVSKTYVPFRFSTFFVRIDYVKLLYILGFIVMLLFLAKQFFSQNYSYFFTKDGMVNGIGGAFLFVMIFYTLSVYVSDFYEGLFYNVIKHSTAEISYIISQTYVPFRFPGSLLRIKYHFLLIAFLYGLFARLLLRQLLHKGYIYAFTKEGITDFRGRFFPWSEIKSMKKERVRSKGGYLNYINITFKKPYVRFSKYPWLFPKQNIMIDIDMYYAEQIDAFYVESMKDSGV